MTNGNAPSVRGMKIYVPARDFEESKRFYADLGFTLTEAWNGNVDVSLGPTVFRLQNYYVKEWAGNFMIQFDVEDALAWETHARSIIEAGSYQTAHMMPSQQHGEALITNVVDPSGVLLVFVQL